MQGFTPYSPAPQAPGHFITRSGLELYRIFRRYCTKLSNACFYGAGENFDPMKAGTGAEDSYGELRVLADLCVV